MNGYRVIGWCEEIELDNDDDRPGVWFLTVVDPGGEEVAIVVHRTVDGKFPLDGEVAKAKEVRAQRIADALNALPPDTVSEREPSALTEEEMGLFEAMGAVFTGMWSDIEACMVRARFEGEDVGVVCAQVSSAEPTVGLKPMAILLNDELAKRIDPGEGVTLVIGDV